jgi:hypothetical protein
MRPEYKIYRNLHKDCFSVLKWNPDKKGYRLFKHVKELRADAVRFKVHESGRQRVLRDRQKNVHAYILCRAFEVLNDRPTEGLTEVYYNPYATDSFVIKDRDEAIHEAESVILFDNKCFIPA